METITSWVQFSLQASVVEPRLRSHRSLAGASLLFAAGLLNAALLSAAILQLATAGLMGAT